MIIISLDKGKYQFNFLSPDTETDTLVLVLVNTDPIWYQYLFNMASTSIL